MYITTKYGRRLFIQFHGAGRLEANIYACYDMGKINPNTNRANFAGYLAYYKGAWNDIPCGTELLAETRARNAYRDSMALTKA